MPENTGEVRAIAIDQGKPMNTQKKMKNACRHVCYNAARYTDATRTTRSRMNEHEEVQLQGHHREFKTHEGGISKRGQGAQAKHDTNHKRINALALGRQQN